MGLENLNLNFKYRSNESVLFMDFYNPCLSNSIKYDRAAGYFSSHSLQTLAQGFESFLTNDGKIRIVANPYLTDQDIEAIEKGHRAKKDIIEKALLKEIDITKSNLQQDTLNVLAWLIYNDQLEIKIAFTNNNSLYHEKFGVFYDENGPGVAFSGSSNETAGGLRDNFEKIDVYSRSTENLRIIDMVTDFENLWSNNTNGLTVISIPDSVKKELLCYKSDFPVVKTSISPKARPYQKKAIDALINNNWHGIFEMATGTGKTITSLLAAKEYLKEHNRMFLVIFVPFTHLVDQWKKECQSFQFTDVTLCYGTKNTWLLKIEREIRDFKIGISDFHLIITTYKTAGTSDFLSLIESLPHNAVLIADECHYLGANAFKSIKLTNFQSKIGLSATPDRWWDEDGTKFIKDFFREVVFTYSLEQAINNNALTNYIYNPIVTDLTKDELEHYERITNKLAFLYLQEEPDKELIERLNLERSLIIARAENKIIKLLDILSSKEINSISHTLVYCAPKQVNILTKKISELGIKVHRFDSNVKTQERESILKSFSEGKIQILVAIKCLDEGVDVPSTRIAYFLASTSNPREFVQRRGRILRNSPQKTIAEIHDFIILPIFTDEKLFKVIASKEIPRFAEFSSAAINKYEAHNKIGLYLDRYNLTYLMEMKPWDVYKTFREDVK